LISLGLNERVGIEIFFIFVMKLMDLNEIHFWENSTGQQMYICIVPRQRTVVKL
jgi:hypothetical protein